MGEGQRVGSEASQRVDPLAGVDWGEVHASAILLARSYVREDDIDDVVNEGIRRVIEGISPFGQASGGTLAEHIVRVGTNARRVELRKLVRRSSERFVAEVTEGLAASAPADPEERLASADGKAKLFHDLEDLCAGDPDALAVLDCIVRQIHEPADQVRATGLAIEAVRNARKRLKRHSEALAEGGER
jgi:hypothetical protein